MNCIWQPIGSLCFSLNCCFNWHLLSDSAVFKFYYVWPPALINGCFSWIMASSAVCVNESEVLKRPHNQVCLKQINLGNLQKMIFYWFQWLSQLHSSDQSSPLRIHLKLSHQALRIDPIKLNKIKMINVQNKRLLIL